MFNFVIHGYDLGVITRKFISSSSYSAAAKSVVSFYPEFRVICVRMA